MTASIHPLPFGQHHPIITDDLDSLLDEINGEEIVESVSSTHMRVPLPSSRTAEHTQKTAGVPPSKLVTSALTPGVRPFPWEAVATIRLTLVGQCDRLLVGRIKSLSCKTSGKGGLCDYFLVADELCALGIELNSRRVAAPRFRFARRPAPMKAGVWAVADATLLMDRQIIDLDWLWQSGRRSPVGGRDEFANLLGPEGLDRDLAHDFACINVKLKQKLDWIALDEADELALELDTIQSEKAQRKWATIMRGVITRGGGVSRVGHLQICGRLHTAAKGDPVLSARADQWALLWACDRLADGDRALAIRLLAKAECSTTLMDASNFSRTLKKIEALAITPRSMVATMAEVSPEVA